MASRKVEGLVSDLHLAEIAKTVVEWEDLAPYLHLTEAEVVEIRKDNNGYRQQKVCCLRRWKESYGDRATYQCLMKAAQDSGQGLAGSFIRGLCK